MRPTTFPSGFDRKPGTGDGPGAGPRNRDTLKWHPAFFQALSAELEEYGDSLSLTAEYQLTSAPLRIDVVIVKKNPGLVIGKNIGRIWRTVNIIEYKSPEDYFSLADFLKVYAYACLYAVKNRDADFSDITLSFAVTRYPRKLIKYLVKERGYLVEERSPGIYEITGDYLPMQIIEARKLPAGENLWLRSLRGDLEAAESGRILEAGKERDLKNRLDAYFDVLLRANPEAFREEKMGKRKKTFEEVFTEAGIIPEWLERGRTEGRMEGRIEIAKTLLEKGWPLEEVSGITNIPVGKLRGPTEAVPGG